MLREAAKQVLVHEKTPLGKGFNEYVYEENRKEWKQYNDMVDPDTGQPMMSLMKVPGTRRCAYEFRKMYHLLKKAWKAAHGG